MISKEIRSKIDTLLKDDPNLKGSVVATKLISEDPELSNSFTIQTLAYCVSEYVQSKNRVYQDAPEVVEIDVKKDKPKWEVIENVYHWKSNGKDIVMPVSHVDEIFADYSIFGKNMTQIDVWRKHNIKDFWNSFKFKLGLVKHSEPYSPYTWQNMTPQEQQEAVATRMQNAHDDKQEVISRIYETEKIKQYHKKITEINKKQFGSELFVSEFLKLMPETYTNRISVLPSDYCTLDWLVSVVTDIHIGLDVNKLKHAPEYNTQIIRDRLVNCAKLINAKHAKDNYIALTGDLIESFTGMNHATSWKDVEKGMTGGPLVVEAINVLCEFLSQINNIKKVIIIAGNHDRAAAKKDEDTDGAIAYIMAHWIKDRYKDNFEVVVSSTYEKLDFDDIKTRVLFEHGDKPLFKSLEGKKKEANIYEYRKFEKSGYRTVIFSGHLHKQGVLTHTWDISKYICPSIATGADYSEKLGLDGASGLTFFFKNELDCGAIEFSDLQKYEQLKVE